MADDDRSTDTVTAEKAKSDPSPSERTPEPEPDAPLTKVTADAPVARSTRGGRRPAASEADPPAPTPPPSTPPPTDLWERIVLYLVAAAVLGGLAHMYFSSTASLAAFQDRLHEHLAGDEGVPRLCGASVLLAEHALAETSSLRLVQLTMGAVLCIFGGLFVIRGVQAHYALKTNHGGLKSALETSSPGLVLITLAIVLMALATREQMKFSFTPPPMCLAGAFDVSGVAPPGEASAGGVSSGGPMEDAIATAIPPDDEPPPPEASAENDGGD